MSTSDNVSEIHSLYSHPRTRGTSTARSESNYLPTPLEGPGAQQSSKPAFIGPRSLPGPKGDLDRVHSSLAHDSRYDGIHDPFPTPPEFRSPQECGPEPYEEYFSIPVSKENLDLNDVRRRRSAKELIKRFESMSAANSSRHDEAHGSRDTPVRARRADVGLSIVPNARFEKKTSPLRQSFRNLLSVFKKGKRFGREKMEPYVIPKDSKSSSLDEKRPTMPPRVEPASEHDPFSPSSGGPGSRICTSPTYSLHIGTLLRLSVHTPISSPILPVWIPCEAALHRSHILLTSATAQGIARTDVVSLRACTDVKSLTTGEIGAEQRALLPTMENSADPKVFELLFDGKEKQRFAAPTVKARAAWVSAIWGIVLRNQENERLSGLTKTEISNALGIDNRPLSSQPSLPGSPVPDLEGKQASGMESDSPVSQGRELPTLSRAAASMRSTSTAVPPSPTKTQLPSEERFSAKIVLDKENPVDVSEKRNPEPEPSSSFKPPSDSSGRSLRNHSCSPSIVNLGRRSVVRKRLAEIRHYPASRTSTSPDSCQSPTSLSSKAVTRERSTSSSVTAPELTDSGGPIERLPANTEQLTTRSPISSRASPLSLDDRLLTSPVSMATGQTLSSRPKSVFRLRDEMRTRDFALLQRRSASGRSSSPEATSYVSLEGDGPIGALLDVMDVHAERQLIKTAELGDKLEAVQNDMQDVANNVHVAISGWEQDSRHLAEIHTAVDDVRLALAQLDAKQQDNIPTAMSIDERLRNDQAQIFQALEEIQTVLKSSTPSSTADGEGKAAELAMHNLKESTPGDSDAQMQNTDDEGARAQLMEQQAESVRYLNELNTWLETFVNGGTAQIMAIADDVQKLCKALGNVDELQGDPLAEGGAADAGPTVTLLQGMRRLAEDSQRRDRDSAHLLSTMNGLVAALNEDMRKNAEMRNAYTTESVLGVIERQRQDQERMLRTLANDLSDDIRGERLRFVEAMKEATAINVQKFKKELTREVLISTQEVGRLQRERQSLEQQIADLLAFYSKQKKTVMGNTQPPSQPLQPLQSGQEQNRPPSRGRALPLPPPGQGRRA